MFFIIINKKEYLDYIRANTWNQNLLVLWKNYNKKNYLKIFTNLKFLLLFFMEENKIVNIKDIFNYSTLK